jgi:hypothetical protein
MSQENVELVLQDFEYWNRGDMEAFVGLWDDAVVLRAAEGWPEPCLSRKGRSALLSSNEWPRGGAGERNAATSRRSNRCKSVTHGSEIAPTGCVNRISLTRAENRRLRALLVHALRMPPAMPRHIRVTAR